MPRKALRFLISEQDKVKKLAEDDPEYAAMTDLLNSFH